MVDRISLPELARRMDDNKKATNERFDQIEESLRWIRRAIVTTMFSILGTVLAAIVVVYLTRQV